LCQPADLPAIGCDEFVADEMSFKSYVGSLFSSLAATAVLYQWRVCVSTPTAVTNSQAVANDASLTCARNIPSP